MDGYFGRNLNESNKQGQKNEQNLKKNETNELHIYPIFVEFRGIGIF